MRRRSLVPRQHGQGVVLVGAVKSITKRRHGSGLGRERESASWLIKALEKFLLAQIESEKVVLTRALGTLSGQRGRRRQVVSCRFVAGAKGRPGDFCTRQIALVPNYSFHS